MDISDIKNVLFRLMNVFIVIAISCSGIWFFSHYKTLDINQLNINANIKSNGDVDVSEVFEYKFHGKYNGVFREYKKQGNSSVKINGVYILNEDGEIKQRLLLSDNNQNGTYELLENDTYLKIYTQSKDETKFIKIDYTILNGIKNYVDTCSFDWDFYDVGDGQIIKEGYIRLSFDSIKDTNFLDLKCNIKGLDYSVKNTEADGISFRFKKARSYIGINTIFNNSFLVDYNIYNDYNYNSFGGTIIDSDSNISNVDTSTNKGIFSIGSIGVNCLVYGVVAWALFDSVLKCVRGEFPYGRYSRAGYGRGRRHNYGHRTSRSGRSRGSSGGF